MRTSRRLPIETLSRRSAAIIDQTVDTPCRLIALKPVTDAVIGVSKNALH